MIGAIDRSASEPGRRAETAVNKFRCRSCQTIVSAPERLAGKVVACPSCKQRMRVPDTAPSDSAPSDSATSSSAPAAGAIQSAIARSRSGPRSSRKETYDDVEVVDVRKRRRPRSRSYLAAGIGVGVAAALLVGAGIGWMMWSGRPGAPVPGAAPVEQVMIGGKPVPVLIAGKPVKVAAVRSEFRVPIADAVEQAKAERDLLAHHRRTLVEAYDKAGKKNPAWDASAREVLEAAAKLLAGKSGDQIDRLHPQITKLVDAGCDDPMILYFHGRSSLGEGKAQFDRMTTAGKALADSKYPAFRRAVGMHYAAQAMIEQSAGAPDKLAEASDMLDAALATIALSRTEDAAEFGEHPDLKRLWAELPERIAHSHERMGRTIPDVLLRMDPVYQKSPPMESYRLLLRGQLLTDYAWQARGNEFADKVAPAAWQRFDERLAQARKALEGSWRAEPNSRAAAQMITVVKGQGGERAAVTAEAKLWFDRAMQANRDDSAACEKMLLFLDPRWFGSPGLVVGFGQSCRDSKNWRAGITLLVAEAHCRAVGLDGDAQVFQYMRNEEVWNDIQSVYEEYLGHRPADRSEHFRYGVYCSLCGKSDLARKHFELAQGTVAAMFVQQEMTIRLRDAALR